MSRDKTPEEFWRKQLTKHQPAVSFGRWFLELLPSHPRCKLCNAPFGAPGGTVMRLIGRSRSRGNPTICDTCQIRMKENLGGVEIEISMLFSDVRGSTALAERISASEFSAMLTRFYAVASDVLIHTGAMLNYPAGDQVSGFFFPAFAGENHASAAIDAGLDLLQRLEHEAESGREIPVGTGVHTGVAYCGAVETAPDVFDHVVLGDAVNTVARLSSEAAAGELLISEASATAAGYDTTGLEQRELQLKGRSEPVRVWAHRASRLSPASM
jgi:adenylate cyclase